MNPNTVLVLLTLASLLWVKSAHSETAQDPTIDNTTSNNEPSAGEANSTKSIVENEVEPVITVTDGASANRSRKLGDAFKNFQPSEEISADNPVPFPVDI